jgi:hypothetical protein
MLTIKKWDLNEIKKVITTSENEGEKQLSIRLITDTAISIV